MSAQLRIMVVDYLRVRRSLGYKLAGTEHLLFAFVDYLEDHDAPTITVEHAVKFAVVPSGVSPRWHALRLSAIRCFTRWAHTLDPDVQIPPARLLPARVTRAAPYLYTGTEVTAAVRLAGGFTVAACYGDFADGVSVSAPEAWRMIIVLRRE